MSDKNKRMLVTGACGSVGSALVRHLIKDGYTVCAFDQSEDGLFKLDQELGDCSNGRLRTFLGTIRDSDRLKRAFEGVDVVFHCAALKHVYISEYNPFEAIQTNIDGVQNVIQACIDANVERAIFTSSDKAVNPTSTMGATKLLGERLFIAANHYVGSHRTRFSCVRFGNVLNSNGSVLQIFRRQLDEGRRLTITSTGMTRFFISMEQAVDLCLFASKEMAGGEIFVLSMGSVDILTLAKSICRNQAFQYDEIGLKPGEKLYEELVTESEAPRTAHNGTIYIVLPDIADLMPEKLKSQYEKYSDFPRLGTPLRSDQDLLAASDVDRMLLNAGLI
jgi:UDP-N-acetylglucosamine 4,6-dehydratase